MPYGTGVLLRGALARATPWQRYVIAAAMIAGGVLLAVLGHVPGILLSLGGVGLLTSLLRRRLARRPASQPVTTPTPHRRER